MPESIAQQFKSLLEENLSIDLTRGKPSSSQLDLSNELLSIPLQPLTEDGVDIRNYGEPLGIHQARELGAELLDSPITHTIAASNQVYCYLINCFLLAIFLGLMASLGKI